MAPLTDRILVRSNRPQRYGTQLSLINGKFVLKPIENKEQLDNLRTDVGLPPIEGYLKLVAECYKSSNKG
jgi:hypothetical protein